MGIGKFGGEITKNIERTENKNLQRTVEGTKFERTQSNTHERMMNPNEHINKNWDALADFLNETGEKVEHIENLAHHDGQEELQDPGVNKAINGLDVIVESRRTSFVQGEPMAHAEKRQYILDYEHWQGERAANRNRIKDYPQELKASNANLERLTELLEGDARTASDSFEEARFAMRVLIRLCKREEVQDEEELNESFGMEYETAYQNAVDAVNAYLDSHSTWRWSSQGRERKRWMSELRDALESHKKYAAQIISGCSEITNFRNTFADGHGMEMINAEMALWDQEKIELKKTATEHVLKEGTPRQVVKTLSEVCTRQTKASRVPCDGEEGLVQLREKLLQKIINSPFAEQVECARILVCFKAGLTQKLQDFQEEAKKQAPPMNVLIPGYEDGDSYSTDPLELYAEMRLFSSGLLDQKEALEDLLKNLDQTAEGADEATKERAEKFSNLVKTIMQGDWNGRGSIWEAEDVSHLEDGIRVLGLEEGDLPSEVEQPFAEKYWNDIRSELREQDLAEVVPSYIAPMKTCYQKMMKDGFDAIVRDSELTNLLHDFLEEDHLAPKNRIEYISKFWLIRNMAKTFVEEVERALESVNDENRQERYYQLYTASASIKRKDFCKSLLQQMDEMNETMREIWIMKPEEDESEVNTDPALEKDTAIPLEIQRCVDIKTLRDYMNENEEDLSGIEKLYLENRIHMLGRIDKIKGTNVSPQKCSVYHGEEKVSPGSEAEIDFENDKFMLEDVTMVHAQDNEGDSVSLVLETMFRHQGQLLHHADIRSYCGDAITDETFSQSLRSGNDLEEEGDVKQVRGLVDRATDHVALQTNVVTGVANKFQDTKQIADQLKEELRYAIYQVGSPVGIRYKGHYVVVTGIHGNTVFYKDPNYKKAPNKTLVLFDIRELVNDSFELDIERRKAGDQRDPYAIEMFWLKRTSGDNQAV